MKYIQIIQVCDLLRSGVFIVNFEHISQFFSSVFIDGFGQANVSWKNRLVAEG